MIVILCGPPGAGKTSLTQEFVKKYPCVNYFSIDAEQSISPTDNIYEAWGHLTHKALANQPCIVECAGTGRGFEEILLPATEALKGSHLVVLTAAPNTLYERLSQRPASLQLSPRSKSLEYMAIDYCSEIMRKKYGKEKWIATDKRNREQIEREFTEYMLFVFQDEIEE